MALHTLMGYSILDSDYFGVEAVSGTVSISFDNQKKGTVYIGSNQTPMVDFALQYSYDQFSWYDYTFGTPISTNAVVYFRTAGTLMEGLFPGIYTDEDNYNYVLLTVTGPFNLKGKLDTLTKNRTGYTTTWRQNSHWGCPSDSRITGIDFFVAGNTFLKDASRLILSDYLGFNWYGCMFKGCTSLKNAPSQLNVTYSEAPGDYNYGAFQSMFEGCTSLINPPELPAMTYVNTARFYKDMFKGCTSLVTAPNLPATNITSFGPYAGMFEGCTSLVTAPTLGSPAHPGTGMFKGCTSLIASPYIENGAESLFEGCTSLVNICALPSGPINTGTGYSWKNMFKGCASLMTLPTVGKASAYGSLNSEAYHSMFEGCTSIKVSETQTTECPNAWSMYNFQSATTDYSVDMFKDTGGTFTGSPYTITTYYTNATVLQPLSQR